MSRIIVKNLPSTINEKKLRDIFKEKGSITDLQMKYNKAGVFRKFAFVGYKTEEEAKAAKEYFNNTFVFTSKIQVEICSNLNDPNKPKPWKEFLKEKDEKTKLIETNMESPTKENKKKKGKSSKAEESDVPEELRKDPKFKEFMAVHEDRKSKPLWADDILAEEDSEKSESSSHEEDDGYNTSQKGESEHEEKSTLKKGDQNKVEVKSGENKDTKKIKEKPEQVSPKKAITYDFVYTVKLRNLRYSCKKKQIKEFFQPLKIASLRIPQRNRGFAYVSFKTEKDMNKALNKHRGYLDGHRIDVVKFTRKERLESEKNAKVEFDKKVDLELLAETGRIYVRNLCFDVIESDMEQLFSKYGPLSEVYLPIDRLTKKAQGFAFITYLFAEHAVKAFTELDGTIYQGRLLHLIPAEPKREEKIDENETNYKKIKEAKLKALSGSSHNWNILFLGSNAVADIIAEKYNVDKAKLLSKDSKESVAVRMALSETQLVLDTRKFLVENGVQLDAFSQPKTQRSKTVILVKHLPAKTSAEELNEKFSAFGTISRIVLPPSGMVALIEFQEPTEAKNAFTNLAYKRFHHLPLYLEWAPVDGLKEPPPKVEEDKADTKDEESAEKADSTEKDEAEANEDVPSAGTTLFVKNLNFDTKQEDFKKHFEKCGPVYSASISTKKDLKTGKVLSMGFGFVQYKEKTSAVRALNELQLSKLDGHALEIKFSTRATVPQATIKRKKQEVKKQLSSKILVRNIPFQASENEVEELFREFGMLKFVRLPKKMGINEHRGFGFVEFVTKSDAKRAFDALCHSTHFYGRRLVLEWANPESEDVDEIRKKTARDFAESLGGRKTKISKSKFQDDVALASARSLPTDE